MSRLVVVGGGVLGTQHAVSAIERGWEVVHLEREGEPRGASVRNFGLVWVSGRAGGEELDLALAARARWEDLAGRYPDTGFRPNGSLTVARTPSEVAVLEAAVERADAAVRGFSLLDPPAARRVNPALSGPFLAALHCPLDAAVEPRLVLSALRAACLASGRYQWLPGREARSVGDHEVVAGGRAHRGDLVVLCPGAATGGLMAELLAEAPLRRVRLQMLETGPAGAVLPTSLADGDSLRYYPAFDLPARRDLPPQSSVAAEWAAQLLLVQRAHGGLTIGDTHRSEEPFPFDVEEAPTTHLLGVAECLLGAPLPPVVRRWAGVYSQRNDDDPSPYYRADVAAGVQVVTGPGGRGMTLSPAIAEATFS